MRQAAVIMAGGSGTRLWPLSRAARPKQLLPLINGRSLLQDAVERLSASLPPEQIYVITLAKHLPAVAAQAPSIPPENLIGEPVGRDTASAIALAAAILHRDDPDTVMGVFTADHYIQKAQAFGDDFQRAIAAVENNPAALVTFGIRPARPHTGYGYIERGERIGPGVYRVASFREKPDAETAAEYVSSGRHYWNSGMFVWRTAAILGELRKRLPDTVEAVTELAEVWHTPESRVRANDVYPTLTRISIDFAVMEHARDVLMVESHFDWHDVGSWTALPDILPADEHGNVVQAAQTALIDTGDCIIWSDQDELTAALGVRDLVIVRTAGVTLVCPRDRIQDVKSLVARIDEAHGSRYT